MPVYTVSQITQYVKESLEMDSLLADLWISAEVSNLRSAPSGHSYFTLKDSHSQLRTVMFKGGRGSELLSEGGLVMAHGRISFYVARGDVQLVADLVMPEGTGPLFLQLEKLKMRLQEEGLFETSRKRPLPRFPRVIGVVTSPTGAVLHDIRTVLGRRYPLVEVLLAPAQVQGEGAASQVVSALHGLNTDGRAHVIVLARGGGSLEELWPFNQEEVARAIYASRIPVVSAVGHERDFTIADLVADLRAPTPSAAAEMVVPDMAVLLQDVRGYRESLLRAMAQRVSSAHGAVETRSHRLRSRAPDIDTLRRRVDDLAIVTSRATARALAVKRDRVGGLEMRLRALNPRAILNRGYAVLQKQPAGQPVSRVGQVRSGEELKVTVSDGSFPATVDGRSRPHPKKQPVRAGAPLL